MEPCRDYATPRSDFFLIFHAHEPLSQSRVSWTKEKSSQTLKRTHRTAKALWKTVLMPDQGWSRFRPLGRCKVVRLAALARPQFPGHLSRPEQSQAAIVPPDAMTILLPGMLTSESLPVTHGFISLHFPTRNRISFASKNDAFIYLS